MEFLSFVTNRCLADARHHGVEKEVKKLAEKIEQDQSISSWDKFLPSPYIKKSLGRDWRVIAERQPLQDRDVIVICFLTLLSRGAHEYDKFIEDPANFGNPLLPPLSLIEGFAKERLAGPPPPVLPPPSGLEYGYLYSQLPGFDRSEGMIFESKDWVESIAN